MRKRNCYWRIAAVVLVLSLFLAGNYVEYGKGVRASEAEAGGKILEAGGKYSEMPEVFDIKKEPKEQRESESESETESEPGNQPEQKIESEPGTELEPGMEPEPPTEPESSSELSEPEPLPETETESEPEPGMEPEPPTESESSSELSEPEPLPETETESEPGTELESEPPTEAESSSELAEPEPLPETEAESEPEPGTEPPIEPESSSEPEETETQTEPVPSVVTVKNIQAEIPAGGRIYDGTDQISLVYKTEGLRQEDRDLLKYEAHLEGSSAGKQKVNYRFWISGQETRYQIQVEEADLTVQVLPKQLTVTVPDGWKVYGYPAAMEYIHLLGEVQVEGFIKNQKGEEKIPKGFQMPRVCLDAGKVSQWSEIYEQGAQKNYGGALVLQRDKKGKILGNPTENYVFPGQGEYKKGDLKIVQNQAVLGRDYEIRDQAGQFGYSADGTLWVRRGTSLEVSVLEGSGYSEGAASGALWQDGVFSFSLKRRNENGEILADSENAQIAYRIDEQVPVGEIRIQGAGDERESYYSNQPVTVEIGIPEDGKSGIKSAEYFIFASREAVLSGAIQGGWQDCREGTAFQLSREGSYTVYVKTEDHTGNRTVAKSGMIVVDTTAPQFLFQGIRPNSANSQEAALTVSCSDHHYEKGSLTVQFSGANGGRAPSVLKQEDGQMGGALYFADFPYEKAFDDVYTVAVAARDQAGNESLETFTFSVNRFGSVYDLETETGQKLQSVYHSEAFPVVFLENNIDFVGEVQILCSRNGELLELQQGKDYIRERKGEKESWKQYRYEISPNVFKEEGTYEVLLLSKDRARNSQDTQTQEKSVRFVIDRSAPECLIVGAEDQKIYQTEELWLILEPRDNGKLKKMEIYLNGEKKEIFDGAKIRELGGLVKWKAEGNREWQNLRIYVEDEAGNSFWTEEISFLVTGERKGEEKGMFSRAGANDQNPETKNTWRTAAFFSMYQDGDRTGEANVLGESGGRWAVVCVCAGLGIFAVCRWIIWRYRKKTWTFGGSYGRINHKERKR